MNWNVVVEYLPEGLTAVLSLVGFLLVWIRNGSIKKTVESLCPSFELVLALQKRVDELEFKLSELTCVLTNLLEVNHVD